MKLLAIVVNFRTPELTVKAVAGILPELERLGGELVVVENGSGDGSTAVISEAIASHGWADRVELLVSPRNGGFGAGVNIGLRHGLARDPRPDCFYLLNPDAVPDDGAVTALIEFLAGHPTAGIVGSHLYTPDGTPHSSGFRFPTIFSEFDRGLRLGAVSRLLQRWIVAIPPSDDTLEVDWVSGASMMIRREVVERVGLFDETFFLYFEETDYCMRAHRAGWRVWYVGHSKVWHIGGAATGFQHHETRKEVRRPLPAYWFESRRHYFEKSHGTHYRVATDVAFIASFALWRVRRLVQRRPDSDPPGLLRDFVRHSAFPTGHR